MKVSVAWNDSKVSCRLDRHKTTNSIYSAGERLEEEERRKEREQMEASNSNDGEDHVLKSLFEMTGIQSALQHDQIMDSASHDAVFVEREGISSFEQIDDLCI